MIGMTVIASVGITPVVVAPVSVTPVVTALVSITSVVAIPVCITPVFFMEPGKIPDMIPAVTIEKGTIVVKINGVAVMAAPCWIIRVKIEIGLNRVFIDGSGRVLRAIFVLIDYGRRCRCDVYAGCWNADAYMATNINLRVGSGGDQAAGDDQSSN
jgi:hypothetical protein